MNTTQTRSRKAWMVGALALALAGTAVVSAHAYGPDGGGMRGGMMMDGGGPGHGRHMGGGRHIDRMLDAADATQEQRIKIKQIMVAAQEGLRSQRESRWAQRDEMARLLSQPKIDSAAVEKLRQQQLAQHDANSKRMTAALVEAAQVLSPQQRSKVAELMMQRRDRGPMGMGPGASAPSR